MRVFLGRLYLFSGYLTGVFVVAIFALMKVLSAGRPALETSFKKIGEQLTADW